jgi:hypothetical protein
LNCVVRRASCIFYALVAYVGNIPTHTLVTGNGIFHRAFRVCRRSSTAIDMREPIDHEAVITEDGSFQASRMVAMNEILSPSNEAPSTGQLSSKRGPSPLTKKAAAQNEESTVEEASFLSPNATSLLTELHPSSSSPGTKPKESTRSRRSPRLNLSWSQSIDACDDKGVSNSLGIKPFSVGAVQSQDVRTHSCAVDNK